MLSFINDLAKIAPHNLATGAVGLLLFVWFFNSEQTKKTVKKDE
jgi:hypothetical protein